MAAAAASHDRYCTATWLTTAWFALEVLDCVVLCNALSDREPHRWHYYKGLYLWHLVCNAVAAHVHKRPLPDAFSMQRRNKAKHAA